MGMKRGIINLSIGIALGSMAASCCPCKNLASTSETKTSDSVNVKTTITHKEKSFFTQADSAAIRAMVKCPESGIINLPEITKKSKNSTVKAGIKNNVLYASCNCTSVEVKLKYQEKLTEIYRRHINTSNAVKVIEIEKIPKWAIYLILAGVASILAWIIKLVIKIYKIFI
jgi:hypothetical protein